MALKLDDLTVESFTTTGTASAVSGTDGGFCCTGCDSGCGIYPTNGGCESASDHGSEDGYCPITAKEMDAAA